MYMDFAGDKLHLTDCHSGKLTPCEVLVLTLGYSNFTRVVALPSQRLDDVVEGLVEAFHAMGGVARALVPDNFKSAITKADRYEPVLNVRFLDMANYYGFSVLPARPGKPKDKAKVEGSVNHVYHRIYGRIRNQSFSTIEQLNERLSLLCDEFNETQMKSYGASRRELLDRYERSQLLDLPIEKYRKVEEYKLKVQTNNHVHLSRRSQYYSVPHRLIGQQVSLVELLDQSYEVGKWGGGFLAEFEFRQSGFGGDRIPLEYLFQGGLGDLGTDGRSFQLAGCLYLSDV
jgi:hypothetical protein